MRATPSLLIACLVASPAFADVSVQTAGAKVHVGSGDTNVNVRAKDVTAISTDGGNASVNVGGIGGDADIQGVTIINKRVYIDNKEIPADVTRYKSPRTGEIYLIQRKGGSVQVTTESEKKK